MTLAYLQSRELGRRLAATLDPPVDSKLDVALLREQYRALVRFAPFLYGFVMLGAMTLAIAVHRPNSPWWTLAAPGALIPALIARIVYWLRLRRETETRDEKAMQRDLRIALFVGPALTFGLSLAAAASLPPDEGVERALALFGLWAAAVACAFCLVRVANAAVLVIFSSSAPLIVLLLQADAGLTFWLAALLLAVSCLLILMLSETYRAFEDIVRSRFVLAEKHRAAEDAKLAATIIANTDDLTGLPNRRWLHSFLGARVDSGGVAPFAVGLMDLDGFKPINDIHGHAAGDEILRTVGRRLAAAMAQRGHAARMGGDEFAVVCEAIHSTDEAAAVGRELQAVFAEPFLVEGLTVHIDGAFGFALFPEAARDADRLLRLADAALYRAKARGRGDVCVFDLQDERAAVQRATLEQALHRAVAERAITVAFQPIVDLASGRVRGFESLARWRDRELGIVPPSVFIPAAEQIGLIDRLSRDLLRQAASAAARWPDDLSLSFNLSPAQLSKGEASSHILALLEEAGLEPSRLIVEVTETVVVKNLDGARAAIDALRAAGVRVALDDFGAGFSSLARVRDLKLDAIKIDRSFVSRICDDPKIASLTESIVGLARRLDLACVAEGIERAEQLEQLVRDGCASGQGWLFAPAMPEEMVASYLEKQEAEKSGESRTASAA
jgi:diguanylate cyclase (GGDEF)-like protein